MKSFVFLDLETIGPAIIADASTDWLEINAVDIVSIRNLNLAKS